jgi:hypothetical protein
MHGTRARHLASFRRTWVLSNDPKTKVEIVATQPLHVIAGTKYIKKVFWFICCNPQNCIHSWEQRQSTLDCRYVPPKLFSWHYFGNLFSSYPHHSTILQPNNFIRDWKIRLLGQKIFKIFKNHNNGIIYRQSSVDCLCLGGDTSSMKSAFASSHAEQFPSNSFWSISRREEKAAQWL